MRKHRMALIVFAFVVALVATYPVASNSAAPKEKNTQEVSALWTLSFSHATPLPKPLVANLQPMSGFQLTAFYQKLKPTATPTTTPVAPAPTTTTTTTTPAPVVSSPPAAPPMPPPTTTTTVPASSGAPLAWGLWPCIEQAESSGRPYITSGLYGILVSTWYSLRDAVPGVADYAYPGAAPISVQNAATLYLYGEDGYRPWNDACTGT
jgi:hypothetical protein